MIKPRITSFAHVKSGRIGVFSRFGEWIVAKGHRILEVFATHAEAITYAQEHAKTEALKEPS